MRLGSDMHGRKYKDQIKFRNNIWLFSYKTWLGLSSSCLFAAFSYSSLYHGAPWYSERTFGGTPSSITSLVAVLQFHREPSQLEWHCCSSLKMLTTWSIRFDFVYIAWINYDGGDILRHVWIGIRSDIGGLMARRSVLIILSKSFCNPM